VLRTEAVVPKYLKRYSMQVNMPEQKIRCLNLNRVSALASKYSTNDRRANRYLSGDESIIHIDDGHCWMFREDRLKGIWRLAKDKMITHRQNSRSTKASSSQPVEWTEVALYDS
jgi:hypothetical protein